MFRMSVCLVAAALVAATLSVASAQTSAPAAAKPSKIRLTIEHLKEMRAKWKENRPKLAACRKQVKARDLVGDERWFYIEDCMAKT